MKKRLRVFFLLFFIIIFSGCSFLKSGSSQAVSFMFKLEKLLVPGKATQFEVEELLGKPAASEDNNTVSAISYMNGDFYLKNNETNKKILKPYIPSYYLEDETRFEKTILMFRFLYDKVKDEYVLETIFFY